MARVELLPGRGVIKETATQVELLPGYGVINETVATGTTYSFTAANATWTGAGFDTNLALSVSFDAANSTWTGSVFTVVFDGIANFSAAIATWTGGIFSASSSAVTPITFLSKMLRPFFRKVLSPWHGEQEGE